MEFAENRNEKAPAGESGLIEYDAGCLPVSLWTASVTRTNFGPCKINYTLLFMPHRLGGFNIGQFIHIKILYTSYKVNFMLNKTINHHLLKHYLTYPQMSFTIAITARCLY